MPEQLKITIPGGGSGCITIEDKLFDLTNNVNAITGTHDNGRHSGKIRKIKVPIEGFKFCPPGDVTQRMAVRIRNLEVRELFTHRWALDEENLNGNRPINELLAAAEYIKKSHSQGIKLLEKTVEAHYLGRVIPVTDDPTHIRVHCQDNSEIDYEDVIGQREDCTPIEDLEFIKPNPQVNSEALDSLRKADLILIPPTSFWTSLMPILKVEGVAETIHDSQADLIMCVNAFTNWSETNNYTPVDFVKRIATLLDRKIDYLLINIPSHAIPQAYTTEKSFLVKCDQKSQDECLDYAFNVWADNFTRPYIVEGGELIRHDGEKIRDRVQKIWKLRKTKPTFQQSA